MPPYAVTRFVSGVLRVRVGPVSGPGISEVPNLLNFQEIS